MLFIKIFYIFILLFNYLKIFSTNSMIFRRIDYKNNRKYDKFLTEEYLTKNFKTYGIDIYNEINDLDDKRNKEIFLVLDKNKENLLNIALSIKNYSQKVFYLEYIENNNQYDFKKMDNKKRPGYKNIKRMIEYFIKKRIDKDSKFELIAVNKNLQKYYKKFGFIDNEDNEDEDSENEVLSMVLDTNLYKNKIKKIRKY